MGFEDEMDKLQEERRLKSIEYAARDLLSTYTFKLGAVLDSNHRCVHHINRVQLFQLQRALE